MRFSFARIVVFIVFARCVCVCQHKNLWGEWAAAGLKAENNVLLFSRYRHLRKILFVLLLCAFSC